MRYDGIQCLRAVAAFLVVWTHLKFAANFVNSAFVSTDAGAVGVDIFFVISGFVISMSAERLNFKWRPFLVNRLCRIVPFYWLMSALFFFWQIWHYTYWRQRIDPHAALNALIFIPFFDFRHFHNPVHTCGWSLSFEFWFYILFALLLAVFGSRALLAVIFALAIPCALVSLFYTGAWFTPKFLFSPFTLEFAAGALLYQLRKYSSVWTLAFAAAGVLVFGAATLKTQAMGFHPAMLAHPLLAFRRALLWGGLGVSSVALTVSLDQWKSLHWPRGLVFLGDCSYSIYLIQPFAVSAALFFGVRHVYGGPYTQGAIYVTFAAIGGVLLSKWIEMPMTRWVKGRLVPAR